eukprot:gene772-1083_t
MTTVAPPVEQWLNSYIFYAWEDAALNVKFDSYINLNYIGNNPDGVLIDGSSLSSLGSQWETISVPGLQQVSAYTATLKVSRSNTHIVKHSDPNEVLAVTVYGIDPRYPDSYSKPAGMAVADLLAQPRCPPSGLPVGGVSSTNIIGYSNCSSTSYAEGATCLAICSTGTSGGKATCTSNPDVGGIWVASDCLLGCLTDPPTEGGTLITGYKEDNCRGRPNYEIGTSCTAI